METKRNTENNENAHLELVLEEFVSELKSQTKSINDLTGVINSLTDKIINFEKEINNPKPILVTTDVQPIQEIVKKNIADIKLIVSNQEQRPLVKKYQLLLFQEQDARLFYKIVFGRWFLWLTISLFLTNLYKFSVRYSDSHTKIKLQILENDLIRRSWDRLYFKSNRGFKKIRVCKLNCVKE